MRRPGNDLPLQIAVLFSAVDAPPGWLARAGFIIEHSRQTVDIHWGENQLAILAEPGLNQVVAVFIFGHATRR